MIAWIKVSLGMIRFPLPRTEIKRYLFISVIWIGSLVMALTVPKEPADNTPNNTRCLLHTETRSIPDYPMDEESRTDYNSKK